MAGRSARAVATYQEVQVTSRSPLELVVMLYDGAIDALRQARTAMMRRDLRQKRAAIGKALQVVDHLQSTLNLDEGGEVAANLDTLYRDVLSRILEANVRQDPELLDEAVRLLTPVRDAWSAIAEVPSTGAAFERAPSPSFAAP
jgi:flagellar protein FliS